MAYREMTSMEILRRLGKGDLVVYLDEEYGYRHWYWFPDMTTDELHAYWDQCEITQHFYDPSSLPGDVVPVPPEYFDGADSHEDVNDYYTRAYSDPRSGVILSERFRQASREEKDQILADYDAWESEFFPNQSDWKRGHEDIACYRAHIHMDDDSWMLRPGEK